MNKKILVSILTVVILAFVHPAEPQQTKRVPRIGYLSGSSPSTSPDRRKAFQQGLRELGYVEGKNIVIEYRYAEGKFDRLPALAAELVLLKVDIIVTTWSPSNPSCQASNIHDSHCDGPGPRSCWKRVRREPCATRREHNRALQPCPGVKRKTIGAYEGDCS
jgi:hypothetical protein